MRTPKVVALACAAVSLIQASLAADCSCGFVGENCTELGYQDENGETVRDSSLKPPAELCNMDHVSRCLLDDDKQMTCECWETYEGGDCNTAVQPLLWNLAIFGFIFPVFFFCAGIYAVRRYHKASGSVDFDIAQRTTTQGQASKMQIFLYRATLSIFIIGVEISVFVYVGLSDLTFAEMAYLGFTAIRFFTVVNALLLQVYFLIGTYLSARAIWFEDDQAGDKPMRTVHKVFYVCMQVELATTILIAVLFWFALFPYYYYSRGAPIEMLVNVFSIVFHGVNVIFMGLDFWMNGLYFVQAHTGYVVIWGAGYFIWHNLVSKTFSGYPFALLQLVD